MDGFVDGFIFFVFLFYFRVSSVYFFSSCELCCAVATVSVVFYALYTRALAQIKQLVQINIR